MLLYLMRHGIAQDREDPESPPDPDRQLTRKGAQRTRAAARGLRALGVDPGAILTSPYLRALATAEGVARELGFSEDAITQTEALLPDTAPARFFEELGRSGAGEVIAVGHAPSIDELCAYALGGGRAPFTELRKAGVACIQLEDPAAPQGRLVWLLEPRMLRGLGKGAGKRTVKRAAKAERKPADED
ncbi:MAG TPA: phosphohistidine phosphatase SixA [Polyangia bacterium]|jgi:phosphohistidine phosphatase